MDIARAQYYRRLAGKIGLLAGLVLLVGLLDGVVTRHRTPYNVVEVLPGQTVELTGPITENVSGTGDLVAETSSDHLRLSFESIFAGYWFGGEMWRGWLQVAPDTPPEKYTLTVKLRDPQTKQPPLVFRINVYPDTASLNRHAISLVQRHAGVSPWWVVALALPVLLAVGLTVFVLSGTIDRFLAQGGKAEVYRVIRRPDGCEVGFGLGDQHGLRIGDRLTLCDPTGHPVGTVEVLDVSAADAVGRTESTEVQAGFLVQKERP